MGEQKWDDDDADSPDIVQGAVVTTEQDPQWTPSSFFEWLAVGAFVIWLWPFFLLGAVCRATDKLPELCKKLSGPSETAAPATTHTNSDKDSRVAGVLVAVAVVVVAAALLIATTDKSRQDPRNWTDDDWRAEEDSWDNQGDPQAFGSPY